MKPTILFIISILVLAASISPRQTDARSPFSGPTMTQRKLSGTWGGPHIRITVENGAASVEYDCANGSIPAPLTIKLDGSFKWRGSFTPERGGPVRGDEKPNRLPAIYSGSIAGDTMTLHVKVSGRDDTQNYDLTKGSFGEVFKCL